MKLIKKSGLLWLILLCTALVLSGCQTDPAVSADTTVSAQTIEQSTGEVIDLVKDGAALYRIVRADEAEQTVVDAAVRVRDLIQSLTGADPEMGTDWVKRGNDHDHESLEILIGMTAYSESVEALAQIPYGDYIITRVGNKLVINAASREALSRAILKFTVELKANASAGNLSLPADIRYAETAVEIVNHLPTYVGGDLSLVYPTGEQNQLLIFENTTPEAYNDYRKKLEAAGYTLYTENTNTDNLFSTYINDKYVVNAGYYPYEKASRIIIEPRTALPVLDADNVYEKKVQPSVAMLGLEFEGKQNGMSFIFQLADGSYIVVDGGFNRHRDGTAIYEYMYANAPDPKHITIAGWFITHAHSDHHGAFLNFAAQYSKKVKLEYVIANIPGTVALLDGNISYDNGGDILGSTTSLFADAKFLRAHTGQVFYMRDAVIEMLYTPESFYPNTVSYFNTSSLIFTVDLGGQRFMILGDGSQDSCKIVLAMYGDYLKSDFVQTAHHGYTTGSNVYSGVEGVYNKAAAPVVLWPLGDKEYPGMAGRSFSRHLQELATTKEIFVAGSRDIRLMLPYSYGTSGYPSILK